MQIASGNRSARFSAKFAAWKAPRLEPGGHDLAAGVVLDERHHLVEDPRLVAPVLVGALLERQLDWFDHDEASKESTQ